MVSLLICRVSIAIIKLIQPILERNGLPGGVAALVCGDVDVGKAIVGSHDIPLSEFTMLS
jgi:aldehyde dehydrogenase family 7 protein A1